MPDDSHHVHSASPESPGPSADELVGYNAAYSADFDGADLQVAPSRNLAIVTCMDVRVDPYKILSLAAGEAHIIRNAGGVVTDDVIRSLCLSQRYLGTREVILVHHTDCGLHNIDEGEFRDGLESEIGVKPGWSLEGFADPHADVAQSIRRLHHTPFLAHKDQIRGFVYDVTDGLLTEVSAES